MNAGSTKFLRATATVAIVIAGAALADAGQRSCRTCQPQGTNRATGGWFHFSSGGGLYVPRASTVSTSVSSPVCQVCDPGRIVGHQPVVSSTIVHPAIHVSRGCATCRSR